MTPRRGVAFCGRVMFGVGLSLLVVLTVSAALATVVLLLMVAWREAPMLAVIIGAIILTLVGKMLAEVAS